MSEQHSQGAKAFWEGLTPEERAAEVAKRTAKRVATMRKKKKAKRTTTRIPRNAIPRPRKKYARKRKALTVTVEQQPSNSDAKLPHFEYEIGKNRLTLVLGALRLPFYPKP